MNTMWEMEESIELKSAKSLGILYSWERRPLHLANNSGICFRYP